MLDGHPAITEFAVKTLESHLVTNEYSYFGLRRGAVEKPSNN